jgi:hypothetical protein
MKKILAAAALIAALAFAGIQTASAHGGRYFNSNNYGPGYCGTYFNNNRSAAYGHGPGMMRGSGWGHGRYVMDW